MDYLPFGEQIAGGSGTTHKFTGLERDPETGLDHALFRQYSSSLGRWTTPDPAGQAACSLQDPQSLNRYAYVKNDPLDHVDPSGLFGWSIFSSFLPRREIRRRWFIPRIILPPIFGRHPEKPRPLLPPGFFQSPDDKAPDFVMEIGCRVCNISCIAKKVLGYTGCGVLAYKDNAPPHVPTECLAVVNAAYADCLDNCERNYCGGGPTRH